MRNNQAPEKGDHSAKELDVHSVFHTIQGEGPFSGRSSIFVRLAGCNLQCPNCDTEYTAERATIKPEHLIHVVRAELDEANANQHDGRRPLVVITGGEPTRQNITRFVEVLLYNGFEVQLETNGMFFLPELPYGDLHFHVVCSPKTAKINRDMADKVDFWKYVASAESLVGSPDGLPLKALGHPVPEGKLLFRPIYKGYPIDVYLSPEDSYDESTNKSNLTACVNSCLKHGYTLSLQTHKLIGVS